jgi:hypothetical protein
VMGEEYFIFKGMAARPIHETILKLGVRAWMARMA